MKRAVLLGITVVMWVAASQVISAATAPNRGINLTPTDLTNPGFEAPTTTTAPASTTTIATTTLATTTTAPPATTSTQEVATTAPPATTGPPATTAPPTTTAPPATTAPTGNFSSAAEADFLGRINGLRGSVGVVALASNADLNNYARWWAKQMADTGNPVHSNTSSLLNPWAAVGENIAYGGSVAAMFNGLSNSPAHHNNMVESRFTNVGVGVYVDPSGRLWTAHVFAG